jgi:hypothetical protein
VPRLARLVALVAIVMLVGVPAPPAGGEHVPYFRYIVLGYVKDARGQPVADAGVQLIRDRTGLAYTARTDTAGLFVVIARLGDESAGETLTLRIGDATTRITAHFDPANHVDERGTRVDLEAGRLLERPAWFRPTLAHFLATDR